MLENFVDRVQESHVQHLVGLVEHNGMHVPQLDDPAVDEVDQAAGGSHDNLCAVAERTDLALYARPAVDGNNPYVGHMFREIGQVRRDLQTELAGRRKDKRLRYQPLGVDTLQYWQPESRRLARSSLRQGDHIPLLCQQVGYNLFLYRHRGLETHFLYRAAQRFADAQFFKCHISK